MTIEFVSVSLFTTIAKPMSAALKWIKKRRDILSISALNAWLKLPPRTLQTYLETGKLQNAAKHQPVIEAKMAAIIANHSVIIQYITQLVNQWKENVTETSAPYETYKKHRSDVDIKNAKQEEAINCLKLLNDVLCSEGHPTLSFLHGQVRENFPTFLHEFKKPIDQQAS